MGEKDGGPLEADLSSNFAQMRGATVHVSVTSVWCPQRKIIGGFAGGDEAIGRLIAESEKRDDIIDIERQSGWKDDRWRLTMMTIVKQYTPHCRGGSPSKLRAPREILPEMLLLDYKWTQDNNIRGEKCTSVTNWGSLSAGDNMAEFQSQILIAMLSWS